MPPAPAPGRPFTPYLAPLSPRSSTPKDTSYDIDAKRAIAITLGVIFGLVALILVLGIMYCLLRHSKSKSEPRHLDDQLFEGVSDDECEAGVRTDGKDIRNSNDTNLRYRGGQGEKEGCCDFFCVSCCGVTRESSRRVKEREARGYANDIGIFYGPTSDRIPRARDRGRVGYILGPSGEPIDNPDNSPKDGPNITLDHHGRPAGPSGGRGAGSSGGVGGGGGGGVGGGGDASGGGSGGQGNYYTYHQHGGYHNNSTNIMNTCIVPNDHSGRANQRDTSSSRRRHGSYSQNRHPHHRSSSVRADSEGDGVRRVRQPDRGNPGPINLPTMPAPVRATQRARIPPEEFIDYTRHPVRPLSPDRSKILPPPLCCPKCSGKRPPPRVRGNYTSQCPVDAPCPLEHFLPGAGAENEHRHNQGGENRQRPGGLFDTDGRNFPSPLGYEIPPDFPVPSSSPLSPSIRLPAVPVRERARAQPAGAETPEIGMRRSENASGSVVCSKDEVDNCLCTENKTGGHNGDDGESNNGAPAMIDPHSSWRSGDSGIELEHPGSLVDFNPPPSPPGPSTERTRNSRGPVPRSPARALSSSPSTILAGIEDNSDSATVPDPFPYENSTDGSPSSSSSDTTQIRSGNNGTWAPDHSISSHDTTASNVSPRGNTTGSSPSSSSDAAHTRGTWDSGSSTAPIPSTFTDLEVGSFSPSSSDVTSFHASSNRTWASDRSISDDSTIVSSASVTASTTYSSSSSSSRALRIHVGIEETWNSPHSTFSDSASIPTRDSFADSPTGTIRTWDSRRSISGYGSEFSTATPRVSSGHAYGMSSRSISSASTVVNTPLRITDSHSEAPSRVWALDSPSSDEGLYFPRDGDSSDGIAIVSASPSPSLGSYLAPPNSTNPAPNPPGRSPSEGSSQSKALVPLSPSIYSSRSASTTLHSVNVVNASPSLQANRTPSPTPSESVSNIIVNSRNFVTAPSSVFSDSNDDSNTTPIVSIRASIPLNSLNESPRLSSQHQRRFGRVFSPPQITITQQTIPHQVEGREGQEAGVVAEETDEYFEGVVVPSSLVGSTRSRFQATVESVVDNSDATGGVVVKDI